MNDDFMVGDRRIAPSLNRIVADGEEISLEPRVMQVLVYLADRPGQVVSREDLLAAVWHDAVVNDEALTRAVFDLRKALGDSAQKPAVIETIRKVGYRLIAPVRTIPSTASPVPPPEVTIPVAAEKSPRHPWLSMLLLPVLLLALIFGAVAAFFVFRSKTPTTGPPAVMPLTSFQGYETHPALSPDGDRLAFAWDGGERGPTDLYLKTVDGENPLQLTQNPAIDDNPAFSPDGRALAFVRRSENTCGIYWVNVSGRDERRLAECREAGISPPTWSPDGNFLVFADRSAPDQPYRLLSLDVRSREIRPATEPPNNLFGDVYPVFSPDGRHLAFVRGTAQSTVTTYLSPALGDLFVAGWRDGELRDEPEPLTEDNEEMPGVAWTPDSRRLIFASTRGDFGYALWQVSLSGGPPVPLIDGEGLLRNPVIASRGGGLAYERWTGATNIRKISINSEPSASQPAVPEPGENLIVSTRSDFNPVFSPDGQRLAWTSLRTGSSEIWISNRDGSSPTRLTSSANDRAGTPAWSKDGSSMAYERRRGGRGTIWIVGVNGGEPRRLTHESVDDRAPSWSHDGERIYFASNRGGLWQVWQIPASGGDAQQITFNGGYASFETADAFYYSKRDAGGVWRSTTGGEELVTALAPEQWGNWTIHDRHLFTVQLLDDRTTQFLALDLESGESRIVGWIDDWIGRETSNLTVSPDGLLLAYAEYEGLTSDLRFVNGFQ